MADRAGGLLNRLRRAAEAFGRIGSLLEIDVLLALLHQAHGRGGDAFDSLTRTFTETPEPESRVRLFLDEGVPMAQLLRDAQRHGIAGDHPRPTAQPAHGWCRSRATAPGLIT